MEQEILDWKDNGKAAKNLDTKEWSSHEWQHFLRNLPAVMTREQIRQQAAHRVPAEIGGKIADPQRRAVDPCVGRHVVMNNGRLPQDRRPTLLAPVTTSPVVKTLSPEAFLLAVASAPAPGASVEPGSVAAWVTTLQEASHLHAKSTTAKAHFRARGGATWGAQDIDGAERATVAALLHHCGLGRVALDAFSAFMDALPGDSAAVRAATPPAVVDVFDAARKIRSCNC